jgi:hypothetical protein
VRFAAECPGLQATKGTGLSSAHPFQERNVLAPRSAICHHCGALPSAQGPAWPLIFVTGFQEITLRHECCTRVTSAAW